MATNSSIGVEFLDGTVKVIRCHWDGFPQNQIPILTKNYKTFEAAMKLISEGDFKELDRDLKKIEHYPSTKPVTYLDLSLAVREMAEYLYVFKQSEGEWFWLSYRNMAPSMKLAKDFKNEPEEFFE